MQKKFLLIIGIALLSLNANAQENIVTIKAADINTLVISPHLNVMIFESPEKDYPFSFDKKAAEKISVKTCGKYLEISGDNIPSSTTIYVYVSRLRHLVVGENSSVVTGILQSEKLSVYVNEGSKAHVKVTGKIKAYPATDYGILVETIPMH